MHVVAFRLLLGCHTFKTRGEEEWHKEINFNYSSEARILATPKLLVSIKKNQSFLSFSYHLLFSSHGNLPLDWKLDKHQHPKIPLGFPGESVVKNPPASAGEDEFLPGLGGLHMQLSNEACVPQPLNSRPRTWELPLLQPTCSRARAPQHEKPPQWYTCAPQRENKPCSLQLEKSPSNSEEPA